MIKPDQMTNIIDGSCPAGCAEVDAKVFARPDQDCAAHQYCRRRTFSLDSSICRAAISQSIFRYFNTSIHSSRVELLIL